MALLKKYRLKTKLILSIMAVTVITIAVTYGINTANHINGIKQEATSKVLESCNIIGQASILHLSENTANISNQFLQAVSERNNYKSIQLLTPEGNIFSSHGSDESPSTTTVTETVEFSKDLFTVLTPIKDNGETIMWIKITQSTEAINKKTQEHLLFSTALVIILLSLSILYANIFAKIAIRPLKKLKNTITKVYKDNNYSIRLDWKTKDEVGTLYQSFNQLIRKIQEREAERNSAEEELKQSENKFRHLADKLPQSVFEADTAGNITYLNTRGQQTFGYSHTDLNSGLNMTDLLELNNEATENLLGIQNANNNVISLDTKAFSKDNTFFHASVYINIITKKEKNLGFSGIIIDNTERIEFEQELRNSKEKAEESDKLKSAFLANMSHEIRSPMNSIIGFADMLGDPDTTDEEKKEYISYINNSSKTLINIIDDIIDIAKIEAGQITINKKDFDATALLLECEAFFNNEAKKLEKEHLQLLIPDSIRQTPLVAHSDQLRLRQILNNLITNAIKFTERGQIELNQRLVTKGNQKMICFSVKDTGIGIEKNKQDQIFERFTKLNSSKDRMYSGTGLGLTISKNLIEFLGGTIYVHSELGKGSLFQFTIPYKKNIAKKSKETMEPKENNTGNWDQYQILVAEDEETNYRFIKAALKKTNIHLEWVKNGKEAIHALSKDSYDLVLMDIKMPEMNGLEATQAIRKFNKDIPIIAQTAYAMSGERKKCFNAGCTDYLSKPIKSGELINTISKRLKDKLPKN